jgi:hypothetical protein
MNSEHPVHAGPINDTVRYQNQNDKGITRGGLYVWSHYTVSPSVQPLPWSHYTVSPSVQPPMVSLHRFPIRTSPPMAVSLHSFPICTIPYHGLTTQFLHQYNLPWSHTQFPHPYTTPPMVTLESFPIRTTPMVSLPSFPIRTTPSSHGLTTQFPHPYTVTLLIRTSPPMVSIHSFPIRTTTPMVSLHSFPIRTTQPHGLIYSSPHSVQSHYTVSPSIQQCVIEHMPWFVFITGRNAELAYERVQPTWTEY